MPPFGGSRTVLEDNSQAQRFPRGKPGTASQFQRRELVAVPALRRAHRSAFSRESRYEEGLIRGDENRARDWRSISPGQTGYSQPIPKAGIGGSPRFAARTPIGIFERVA